MGVFDFVKDAGAKVGIGESTADAEARETAEAEAKADAAQAAADDRAAAVAKRVKDRERKAKQAERMENFEEAKKAIGLESYVTRLGLDVDKLDIRFDDGIATITGTVADQATKEKVILAVGNTTDVETVQEELIVDLTDGAGNEAKLHVVVSGDTLWAVAEEHYGDGSRYTEIFEANRPMLNDPDKIYVGQVLRVPAKA